MVPPPPRSTLFPYTTLFRSHAVTARARPITTTPRRVMKAIGARNPFWTRARTRRMVRGNGQGGAASLARRTARGDRKSTRLNSSHITISYAVFCLKKKNETSRNPALSQLTAAERRWRRAAAEERWSGRVERSAQPAGRQPDV